MSHVALAAGEVKVIRRRPDGSGVVEIPVLTVAPEIGITADVLRDVHANFQRANGAVIVGVTRSPHPPLEDMWTARGGPQPGFVNALALRGPVLFAEIELTADIFGELTRGEWRGFSVEIIHASHMPERLQAQHQFNGFVLTGGVLTNRPATNSTFRIAAEAATPSAIFTLLSVREESTMPDPEKTISLAAHESKVADLNGAIALATEKVSRLEGQVASFQAEVTTLRASVQSLTEAKLAAENDKTVAVATANRLEAQSKQQQGTIAQLTTRVTELELKTREQALDTDNARIRAIVLDAIDPKSGGLPPALFDGWEANPSDYVAANYASLDAFENHVRVLRGVGPKIKLSSVPKSGHDPAKEADPNKALTADEAKVLESIHLSSDFVGVRSEAEARKIFEARKAAK